MNIISRIYHRIATELTQLRYPYRNMHSKIDHRVEVVNPHNLIMGEFTNIFQNAIIMNSRAKFVMKKWSGAASGLVVVTGNHLSLVGMPFKKITDAVKDQIDKDGAFDKDIIVEEDVWIATNVTLLMGAAIGRGAVIGAGSVIRSKVPPYSIVTGNPAKVVGFKFTPEEVIEHEKALYPEEERLPLELLQKNYDKYFINRIKEIKEWNKL